MSGEAGRPPLIRVEQYDGDRRVLQPLFALADDSPAQVAKYLALGVVLIARDGEAVVGHVQIARTDEANVLELRSLAVRVTRQGEGIGRALVNAALEFCREQGARAVVVATATADIENLRFYQRRGFRMHRIVPDAFTAATGYANTVAADGIELRDQIFFRRELA